MLYEFIALVCASDKKEYAEARANIMKRLVSQTQNIGYKRIEDLQQKRAAKERDVNEFLDKLESQEDGKDVIRNMSKIPTSDLRFTDFRKLYDEALDANFNLQRKELKFSGKLAKISQSIGGESMDRSAAGAMPRKTPGTKTPVGRTPAKRKPESKVKAITPATQQTITRTPAVRVQRLQTPEDLASREQAYREERKKTVTFASPSSEPGISSSSSIESQLSQNSEKLDWILADLSQIKRDLISAKQVQQRREQWRAQTMESLEKMQKQNTAAREGGKK